MQQRLTVLLAATAAAGLLLAPSVFAHGPALAIGHSVAVSQASARQSSLPDECGARLNLDAAAAAQEAAMTCLVNQARGRFGLPPLAESPQLRDSAVEKSADLLRCDEFSHTACGRPFDYWIGETGYMSTPCWRVGENLAWGVEGEGTVESIFHAWMHSPDHRANILGNYEEAGLELRVGSLGGLAGVHLWTEHFGSHCGS